MSKAKEKERPADPRETSKVVSTKEVAQKFSKINDFLERNFGPTEKQQEETRKALLERNKQKLKELEKLGENKGLPEEKLKHKIVEVR